MKTLNINLSLTIRLRRNSQDTSLEVSCQADYNFISEAVKVGLFGSQNSLSLSLKHIELSPTIISADQCQSLLCCVNDCGDSRYVIKCIYGVVTT